MVLIPNSKEEIYNFYGDSLTDTGKIIIDTIFEVFGEDITNNSQISFGEQLLGLAKVFELLSDRITNEGEFFSFFLLSITKSMELFQH